MPSKEMKASRITQNRLASLERTPKDASPSFSLSHPATATQLYAVFVCALLLTTPVIVASERGRRSNEPIITCSEDGIPSVEGGVASGVEWGMNPMTGELEMVSGKGYVIRGDECQHVLKERKQSPTIDTKSTETKPLKTDTKPFVPKPVERRSTFGKETVDHIDCPTVCNLDGTTSNGPVKSGTTLTAKNCPQLGPVNAGTMANIHGCPDIDSVTAGTTLTIESSSVKGDVTAGHCETIESVEIKGTLTTRSSDLTIRESKIGAIHILPPPTIKTPSGPIRFDREEGIKYGRWGREISTNARQVFKSSGPRSLTTYTSFDAVYVAESDWDSTTINGMSVDKFIASLKEPEPKKKQVLTLLAETEVLDDITFDEGNGVVVKSARSKINGKVIGGVVQPR